MKHKTNFFSLDPVNLLLQFTIARAALNLNLKLKVNMRRFVLLVESKKKIYHIFLSGNGFFWIFFIIYYAQVFITQEYYAKLFVS